MRRSRGRLRTNLAPPRRRLIGQPGNRSEPDSEKKKRADLYVLRLIESPVARRIGALLGLWDLQGLETVPMNLIRCDDVAYRGQDFAGQPIGAFPMARMYRVHQVDPAMARKEFEAWQRDWLLTRSGWKTPKSEGGMQGGTLFRIVRGLYRDRYNGEPSDFDRVEPELISDAIAIRAKHCFGVFDSIREHGYMDDVGAPMTFQSRGGLYIWKGGHHRASALYVLGYGTVKARRRW